MGPPYHARRARLRYTATTSAMTRLVFSISFLLALTSLTLLFWREGNVIDEGLWGAQAEWFASANAEVFNLRKAYGHPGGPLIEAAIAIHDARGAAYETALALFEVVAGALLIAGIVTLTWVLR